MFYFKQISVILFAINLLLLNCEPSTTREVDCAHKCPINISIANGEMEFKYGHIDCDCPSGWTRSPSDNTCVLYAGATPVTYEDALTACADKYGARLLTIKSESKQQFIEDYMNGLKVDAWVWLDAIRVSKVNANTSYTWSDGTRFLYNNWYPGEPNNGDGDQYCTLIHAKTFHDNGYHWTDYFCDHHDYEKYVFNAICETTCA